MTKWISRLAIALALEGIGAQSTSAVKIGSRCEPFVDDHLIESMDQGLRLVMHRPSPREVVLVTDEAWEGNTCAYYSIFSDGKKFRMYYRGSHYDEKKRRATHREVTCYAESVDGVLWTKPKLGLFEFGGAKDNNIVWDGIGTHCFTVFKDGNPKCKPGARYKAIARGRPRGKKGLYVFQSPDGLRWSRIRDEPVITAGAFDSQNLAFWDPHLGAYREYHRAFVRGVRAVMTGTSRDFVQWTDPVLLKYGDAPNEHLYTNAILPCPRAPHILIGFPTRYLPRKGSRVEPVFMASRDGLTFRRYPKALIPEDAPKDRGGNRSNYMAWGLVTLPGRDDEYSVYATEAYYTGPDSRLRRFVFRVDGFVSVHAGQPGGTFLTKSIEFDGKKLIFNFKTGAKGSIRCGLDDGAGKAIPGFSVDDCVALRGDDAGRAVTWKRGGDVSHLAGTAVRIRVQMMHADLFSFAFR
jgi:hypothetical protein